MTGYMAREFFQSSPLLLLPILALILFVALFSVLVIRTMRMRGVDEAAHLPLSDDHLSLEDDHG